MNAVNSLSGIRLPMLPIHFLSPPTSTPPTLTPCPSMSTTNIERRAHFMSARMRADIKWARLSMFVVLMLGHGVSVGGVLVGGLRK